MLARVQQDPDIQRPTSIVLPQMSFEMSGMNYDGQRKLNTVRRNVSVDSDNPNNLRYQYNPVPYNIEFKLYIYVKNAEDGTKIIEQILPYFTPDFTVTLDLIPEMNVKQDIPVLMNSISQEDTYEGNFTERRAIIWTLDFTMKGYFFGPIYKTGIIKFAITNLYVPSGEIKDSVGQMDPDVTLAWQPGLTANGQPTSNASLSIDPRDIVVTDDFGYVFTHYEKEA